MHEAADQIEELAAEVRIQTAHRDEARDGLAKVSAALVKYGDHLRGINGCLQIQAADKCTCGFERALEGEKE
jgi:hypothetical protein